MPRQTASVDDMAKLIFESSTSGLSPEDILQRLDSYGVEWYLTQQGDLMIKYWQVGAEGVVSPERVGRIQTRPVPTEATPLNGSAAILLNSGNSMLENGWRS